MSQTKPNVFVELVFFRQAMLCSFDALPCKAVKEEFSATSKVQRRNWLCHYLPSNINDCSLCLLICISMSLCDNRFTFSCSCAERIISQLFMLNVNEKDLFFIFKLCFYDLGNENFQIYSFSRTFQMKNWWTIF